MHYQVWFSPEWGYQLYIYAEYVVCRELESFLEKYCSVDRLRIKPASPKLCIYVLLTHALNLKRDILVGS